MSPVVVVLALVCAVLVTTVVLLLVTRIRGGDDVSLLRRELGLVRGHLEHMAAAQGDIPRALAEGQARSGHALADVRERLGALAEATRRIEALGENVAEVQELLRVPRLRGTMGEVWLEELLHQIFPRSVYEIQYQLPTGERVDAALRLAGQMVPIDAKFPLEACDRMIRTRGPDKERHRRAFVRSVRGRVDEIADRYIRPDAGTSDFALMYLPAERLYYEVVIRHPDAEPEVGEGLLAYAMSRRVIPVSPNTLYAYLMTVLHGLRGLRVETRAREILDSLAGLENTLDRIGRTHELTGRHLDHAARQHADTARQIERVRARIHGLAGVDGAKVSPVTDGSAASAGDGNLLVDEPV